MLLEPQDRRALQATFGRVLNDILDAKLPGAPEGTGLDDVVNAALNDLAMNMDLRATKTLAAYEAFANQLNGKNADDAQAKMLKLLGP